MAKNTIEKGDMLIDLATKKAWLVMKIGKQYNIDVIYRIENTGGESKWIDLQDLLKYQHIKND